MVAGLLDSLLAEGAVAQGLNPDWLAAARQRAFQDIAQDGLPSARSEAWKYTNLRALSQRRFQRGDAQADSRDIDLALLDLPGVDGPRMVFVNGVFRADLSMLPTIQGLELASLATLLVEDSDSLRSFLARPFDEADEPFARLNGAFAEDGPVVRVAAGVKIERPVHLVYVGVAPIADLAWHTRAVIDLGAGAALTLVEHHVGKSGSNHFGNLLVQIALREQSRFDFLQVQNAPETSLLSRRTEVALESDAELNLRSIEAGTQWMRHDLRVELLGDRSRFVSRGVFALRGRQHADTRIKVRHQARDTACDIVWRGVADQRSRGIFHGAITVAAGADGADAYLSNKNLLLSEQAEIDTQPVLEIHADEVKAAHGATIGQLDETALFYLRSRGLSADEARSILTLAFCRVVVDSMENFSLREYIDALLLQRLPLAGTESESVQAPA